MTFLERANNWLFGGGEQGVRRSGVAEVTNGAGYAATSDVDFYARLFGLVNAPGQTFSVHQLEGLPAVFAIIRVLAHDLGAIPFDVLSMSDDRRQMANLVGYDLIRHKPNFYLNKTAFWSSFWWNAYLGGAGYAEIKRDNFMNPVGLRLWKWHEVGTTWDYLREDLFYSTPTSGRVEVEDMITVKMNSKDGIFGRTPLEVCAEGASEGLAAQKHGNAFYQNGAKMPGILTVPGRLGGFSGAVGKDEEKKAKEARDRLREGFRTAANSGEVPILEEGVKFTPLDMKFGDIQFLQNRSFTFDQLCSIYGVPPAVVANFKDAKYTNAEQMDLSYVKHTLTNPVTMLEEELLTKLIPRKYWHRVEVYGNMDYLLRGDINTQTQYYDKMLNNRVLTANDILREKRRPTFATGDDRYVSAGSMPEDVVKEYYGKNNTENNGEANNANAPSGDAGTETSND